MIDNVEIFGLESAVRGSKFPMATDISKCDAAITPTVEKLASCAQGTGHDQFLTGIIVQFDLTFSLKAWTEAERYHFFDFISSQSTMHRITKFDIAKQCNKYVSQKAIENLNELLDVYNKNLDEESYLGVLYNIPSGFTLTARMTTNYRQLKTIYHQRKNHRLPEWREFCRWIEQLPHSSFITNVINFDK